MVRASVTGLRSSLAELEAAASQPDTADHTRRLDTRFQSLLEEFKVHHFSARDLLEEEEELAVEQEVFDI